MLSDRQSFLCITLQVVGKSPFLFFKLGISNNGSGESKRAVLFQNLLNIFSIGVLLLENKCIGNSKKNNSNVHHLFDI